MQLPSLVGSARRFVQLQACGDSIRQLVQLASCLEWMLREAVLRDRQNEGTSSALKVVHQQLDKAGIYEALSLLHFEEVILAATRDMGHIWLVRARSNRPGNWLKRSAHISPVLISRQVQGVDEI